MFPDPFPAALHPCDVPKLRELAQALRDISRARLATRNRLEHLVENLMVCMRPDCSPDGAGDVLDRLLGIADHRLGADGMAAAAFAETKAAR